MVKVEIVILLLSCALVCARPGLFDFLSDEAAELGIDLSLGGEDAPEYTGDQDVIDDVTDNETPEELPQDEAPNNMMWECADASKNVLKCVLRANIALPETERAKAFPFTAEPTNNTIPTLPPKGAIPEIKYTKVTGSLADFLTKVEKLIAASIEVLKAQLDF